MIQDKQRLRKRTSKRLLRVLKRSRMSRAPRIPVKLPARLTKADSLTIKMISLFFVMSMIRKIPNSWSRSPRVRENRRLTISTAPIQSMNAKRMLKPMRLCKPSATVWMMFLERTGIMPLFPYPKAC